VDVKAAQQLMRHTKSVTTMDVYTHGVSSLKRTANDTLIELMLPGRDKMAS
jgi:integrase